MSGGAVFVEGAKRPGQIKVGYRPKTGQPRDAEGRLIIVWEYGWPAGKGPAAPPEHIDCPKRCLPIEPAPTVSRGIRAETPQGTLI